jgi:hypothetical protein
LPRLNRISRCIFRGFRRSAESSIVAQSIGSTKGDDTGGVGGYSEVYSGWDDGFAPAF